MSLAQTAVFLHATDGLWSKQSSTASPHVWANLSTLENNGETENPAGVEVAKKLKMDQISLPCQEDFLKFMWSNNIFFSCLSPSRIPKYFVSYVQHVGKSLCLARTCGHVLKGIWKETGRAQGRQCNIPKVACHGRKFQEWLLTQGLFSFPIC